GEETEREHHAAVAIDDERLHDSRPPPCCASVLPNVRRMPRSSARTKWTEYFSIDRRCAGSRWSVRAHASLAGTRRCLLGKLAGRRCFQHCQRLPATRQTVRE